MKILTELGVLGLILDGCGLPSPETQVWMGVYSSHRRVGAFLKLSTAGFTQILPDRCAIQKGNSVDFQDRLTLTTWAIHRLESNHGDCS
jgi:hypothetical protein